MALVLKRLFTGYFWLFDDLADPRTKDYFFMSSPVYPALLIAFYLYTVLLLGPQLMSKRKAFNLDRILLVFNITQVLLNAYLCYFGFKELLLLDWNCAPVDYNDTPHNRFVLRLSYVYFVTKVLDLLDTVFFIMRKKAQQVSFLHVYHHTGMVGLGWAGVKFLGGGHSFFMGVINAFVHTIMYTYYLLTSWNPEYKKSIWWKKHITQLQLLQFISFLVIYGRLLFVSDCAYPKVTSYFFVPQNLFMFILFSDFYWKAYIRKPKTEKHAKET